MAKGRTQRKSGYQRKDKRANADRYGSYVAGKLTSSESIAGRTISDQLPAFKEGRR